MLPDEIKDVLEEVREHIIDYCRLKAGEDTVITTDQVRSAIQKLGEPHIVEKVLQEELETFEQIKESPQVTEITVTAEQAATIFRILSILSTVIGIVFVLYDASRYPVFGLYATHVLLFLISLGWYQLIRTRPEFDSNVYLERSIRLNAIHLLVPQAILLYLLVFGRLRFDPFILTETIFCGLLPFLRDAQDFYKDIWDRLTNFSFKA